MLSNHPKQKNKEKDNKVSTLIEINHLCCALYRTKGEFVVGDLPGDSDDGLEEA